MSSKVSSTNNPTLSGFDDIHADVVLRSSDGVDFPMRKSDLTRASPFFETMFTLPQPGEACSKPGGDQDDGLPIVKLADSAGCLRDLLPFCHPQPRPRINAVDTAVLVLDGAQKYEMAWARDGACGALLELAAQEPVRVYCVACRYDLKHVAQAAARSCLRDGSLAIVDSRVPELGWITAHQFQRLLSYVEDCGRAVEQRFMQSGWSTSVFPGWYQRFWQDRVCCPTAKTTISVQNPYQSDRTKVALWWEKYMKAIVAELRQYPSEERVTVEGAFRAFLNSKPSDTKRCPSCCAAASLHMAGFVQTLKLEVSAQISKVRMVTIPGCRACVLNNVSCMC